MRWPILDLTGLSGDSAERDAVARALGAACRDTGFFYVTGHGIDPGLQGRLERASVAFFAQPHEAKMTIAMPRGGRAWRGYFPVGEELTSGRPDLKEGLYFGAELGPEHPRVRAGTPLHGPNLLPTWPPDLGPAVLDWIEAMTGLGHRLMSALAASLELPTDWFARHYTADPTVLFRIFNYPPAPARHDQWGVGEHTDYGLLTILHQDQHGGLQVRTRHAGWVDVPPVHGSYVCNIGDMLDRLTGGHYRSTPHRVRPSVAEHRLSWPFFFDPGWDADLRPIAEGALAGRAGVDEDRDARWDRASVHEFHGTYGDYLSAKVARVFPDLMRSVR